MYAVINVRTCQWIQMNVENFDEVTKVYQIVS